MSDDLILRIFSDERELKAASHVAKEMTERALRESRAMIKKMDQQVKKASGPQKAVISEA